MKFRWLGAGPTDVKTGGPWAPGCASDQECPPNHTCINGKCVTAPAPPVDPLPDPTPTPPPATKLLPASVFQKPEKKRGDAIVVVAAVGIVGVIVWIMKATERRGI